MLHLLNSHGLPFISNFIGPGFNMITRKYIDYISKSKSCRLAKIVSHIVRNHFGRPQDVGTFTYGINKKFSLKNGSLTWIG